jgi:hypothetical protein
VRWYWQLAAHALSTVRSSGTAKLVEGEGLMLAAWCKNQFELTLDEPGQAGPTAWEAVEYGILRPAQRIRCEADVTGDILLVTFIGQTAVPAEVMLHGAGLVCTVASDSPRNGHHGNGSTRRAGGPAADIRWRIQTCNGWREFSMAQ